MEHSHEPRVWQRIVKVSPDSLCDLARVQSRLAVRERKRAVKRWEKQEPGGGENTDLPGAGAQCLPPQSCTLSQDTLRVTEKPVYRLTHSRKIIKQDCLMTGVHCSICWHRHA